MDTQEQNQPPVLSLKALDEDLKGRFSNFALIHHQRDNADHFVLDFYLAVQPVGQLLSRVIVTPGHLKAISIAMNDQLKQFEQIFGKVKPETPKQKFGFVDPDSPATKTV